MRLAEHVYSTVTSIRSQLLFVEKVVAVRMGEIVRVRRPDGRELEGEVLLISNDTVLIQLFGESRGLDTSATAVVFTDSVRQAPLAETMLQRLFDGSFRPIDGQPLFVPETWAPASGFPINPGSRARPQEFIETGFATIDGLNTLVKGQKLPIFSCAGLPAREMVAAILKNARVAEEEGQGGAGFALVFVALGLTHHEYAFYLEAIRAMRSDYVAFINLADDPVVERLMAPRFGLTAAEYLAFAKGRDVLVVVTDMTNYCDALREVATAREELPGRRGYPGYMYSELASLYERAGRIKGRPGSITMLPVVTMPEDDITHPIPDLTGYITEGQIVLSRELHQRGIFPPVDVLPSLSRLMQQGIGPGRTRADHRDIANQLYRQYARGRDLRSLEVIVGRDGMSEADRDHLDFARAFEEEFVHQAGARRTVVQTLEVGLALLQRFGFEAPP
ncbi:MAG: V-type ATP synthase subunit B [Thermodesulfobacteriota bacterium]